jgi:heme-degrading monooxygenase HmoA
MHARLTTVEGVPSHKMDDAARHLQEQVLPQLQQLDGFEGFIAVRDRENGRLRGLALWESEDALRATDEAAARIRGTVTEATGGTIASVENYEVVVFEAPSAGPISGVTDALGGVTQPVSGVTDTVGGVAGSVSGVTDNLLGGGGGEEEKQR